tara:strand:+ start:140 stop:1699 length:1560 start_codon:yes stop_codon:yes gene_type:complete
MGLSRKFANLGKALDSGTSGEFLTIDDSGGLFRGVQWTEISGTPTTIDSAAASAIVDSAYVQARQVDVGLDSALITSLIDSSYVAARQGEVGLDSAAITGIVDSAYVSARVAAGLDSAGVTGIVDSDYVGGRVTANSGFKNYRYTATAGQTEFKDSDVNGEVLYYSTDGLLVFYNGVALEKTTDFTTANNNTVTLTEGADSGVSVNISTWTISTSSGGSGVLFYGTRGLNLGGKSGSPSYNTIQYFTTTSASDAVDFGDLTAANYYFGAASSGTRVVTGGGIHSTTTVASMDYFETATTGNASDFGDLTFQRYTPGCAGSTTRHLTCGGNLGSGGGSETNIIDYVTYATTGNATDFGDRTVAQDYVSTASDATYAVIGLGEDYSTGSNAARDTLDYVTIATTGNASDFGDLTLARYAGNHGVIGNTTRGLFAGGYGSPSNIIDYITIASPGNATDFGDLANARGDMQSTSDGTTGFFMGGNGATDITQVTIATTGNATSFADLLTGVGTDQGVGASGTA